MKKLFFLCIGLLVFNEAITQNVGIGTTTPTATLQVNGTFRLYDGSHAAGRVLTSDDIGLAHWQSLPYNPPPPPPPVNYPVVWICCNPWMTKNLDVSTYRNGDAIPKVTDGAAWAALTTGAYCYYKMIQLHTLRSMVNFTIGMRLMIHEAWPRKGGISRRILNGPL